jgi:ribosomal protein L37E
MRPFERIRTAFRPDGGNAYECRTCRESFDVQYHVCPSCEGFSVEAPAGRWDTVDRGAAETTTASARQ